MPKMKDKRTPTDEEIMAYNNVPTAVAAAYLGKGIGFVQDSLQQSRAPYGHSVHKLEGGEWQYHISPGLLVAYKNGTLPALNIAQTVSLIAAEAERVLDLRSKAAMEVLCPGLLIANGVKEKTVGNIR